VASAGRKAYKAKAAILVIKGVIEPSEAHFEEVLELLKHRDSEYFGAGLFSAVLIKDHYQERREIAGLLSFNNYRAIRTLIEVTDLEKISSQRLRQLVERFNA
jgi:hypothetical protein